MSSPPDSLRDSKATRARVRQAADQILRSGRRPTVEGVRELLGGGSPSSVTAHISEWYRDLGARLASSDSSTTGFSPAAVALMAELWRLASATPVLTKATHTDGRSGTRELKAERDTASADAKALATLNLELRRHRATAEKSLAEAQALLARYEAALEIERSRTDELHRELAAALVQSQPKQEPLKRSERTRRKPPRAARRSAASRTRPTATKQLAKHSGGKRKKGKISPARNGTTRSTRRRSPPSRRR